MCMTRRTTASAPGRTTAPSGSESRKPQREQRLLLLPLVVAPSVPELRPEALQPLQNLLRQLGAGLLLRPLQPPQMPPTSTRRART